MTRPVVIAAVLASLVWLSGCASVCAQTLARVPEDDAGWEADDVPDTATCADSLRAELPALPVEAEGSDAVVDCARIAGVAVAARYDWIALEDHTESDVRIVTAAGELSVPIDRLRSDAFFEEADVVVEALRGAPHVALVRIVLRSGGHYAERDEIMIVVHLGGPPRLLWVGHGSAESRLADGRCVERRVVTVKERGGTLQIRSRVSHRTRPLDDGDEMYAELVRECRSPTRVRADVPTIAVRPP